jgi:hypothetical protein
MILYNIIIIIFIYYYLLRITLNNILYLFHTPIRFSTLAAFTCIQFIGVYMRPFHIINDRITKIKF